MMDNTAITSANSNGHDHMMNNNNPNNNSAGNNTAMDAAFMMKAAEINLE